MYSQRLLSLLLAALLVLNIPAMGETVTQYYRDDAYTDSVSLDLTSGEEDALTSLLFPRAEVLEAGITISGGADDDGGQGRDVAHGREPPEDRRPLHRLAQLDGRLAGERRQDRDDGQRRQGCPHPGRVGAAEAPPQQAGSD